MSSTTIAINDQTTAFVVAKPTPFAPPLAKYPQVQLIKEIAAPKKIAFKIHTPISFIYKPNYAESKYAR